jgi:hypothetical protein
MNPNECLQLFLSLKLHFSQPSYDFFKYKGELKYRPNITKRRDKYQIMKIAKHPDPQGLLLANLSLNPHQWPGDILSDKGMTTYKDWKKRRESLSYCFQEQIKQLKLPFNDNFNVPKYEHPYVLRLFLGEYLNIETLVILNNLLNFYPSWDRALANDIVWKEMGLLIPKYSPFLQYDKAKMKKIVMEQFSDQK